MLSTLWGVHGIHQVFWDTEEASLAFVGSGDHTFSMADWSMSSMFAFQTLDLMEGSLTIIGDGTNKLQVNNLNLGSGTTLNLQGIDLEYIGTLTDEGVNVIGGGQLTQFGSTGTTVGAVPEPATVALLGIGLAGLAGAEVRRKRKKKAVDKS